MDTLCLVCGRDPAAVPVTGYTGAAAADHGRKTASGALCRAHHCHGGGVHTRYGVRHVRRVSCRYRQRGCVRVSRAHVRRAVLFAERPVRYQNSNSAFHIGIDGSVELCRRRFARLARAVRCSRVFTDAVRARHKVSAHLFLHAFTIPVCYGLQAWVRKPRVRSAIRRRRSKLHKLQKI